MKFTFTDKLIAVLALLSGLSISAVAIYYSVAGLVSIFSAAVVPIVVMGVTLEISKLIATMWLKINWTRAPFFIKAYMSAAIVILMIITSMGIFGFLSKAHSDQSLVSGDVQSRIAIYDEKIKTEKENIEANRKALRQMDEAVDQSMARSTTEQGANRAVNIRQQQARERTRLQNEITASQKKIGVLNEERAPIAAEVRKVEAEVGPIKYIAAFIYGDNPDANVLEKAVTWVIIIIVAVFDPLAVILLLASQYSFQWFRKPEETVKQVEEAEKSEPYVKGDDGFKFLAEYEDLHKYPASEADIDELATAKQDARTAVVGDVSIKDEPVFKEAVDAGIYNTDGTLVLPDEVAPIVTNVVKTGKVLDDDQGIKRSADYVTEPVDFAPPGTPGEQWAVKSEQPTEDNLDKIYKASSEELAKKHRSRGWFQAVFPKKDNQ
jgi:hypothetical protein